MAGRKKNDMPLPVEGEVKEASEPKAEMKKEAKKKSLQVVATRAGYYGGARRRPGEAFAIKDESHLGSWMKII